MKHNVHTWLRKALVWAMAIVFAWSGSGTMALAEEIGQATAAAQEAAGEKTAETTTDAATSAKGDATEAESGIAAEQKGAGAAADETSDAGTANGTASTPQEDATQRDAAASDTTAADTPAADAPAAGTTAQAQPATRTARAGEHLTVTSADELPQTIEAGATVTLGADITLAADQQIESVAGTLDGAGHTITLANKPLANQVSGTIQNLGVASAGTIASEDYLGSLAVSLSGTIQMCWSSASLNLSGWSGEVGGLVGKLEGGTVRNSYFAGAITAMMSGGIVGEGSTGTVENNVFTVGDSEVSMGYGSLVKQNNKRLSAGELKTSAATDILNANAPKTGFSWTLTGGYPQLTSDSAPVVVNKDALKAAVAAATALNETDYETAGWSAFANALANAQTVLKDTGATQDDVNAAAQALTAAQAALVKKKPTAPVQQPESVIHLSTQGDLEDKLTASADAYYVLDNDIVVDGGDFGFFMGGLVTLNGTFDGQGHTITFKNAGAGAKLFAGIGATGVVQNLNVTGEMVYESGNKLAQGPFGITVSGAIINCSTSVTGDNIAGFARTLAGGVVSNCWSAARGTKVGAPLFATYASGRLVNTYWQDDLPNQTSFPASALVNSFAVSAEDAKTAGFVELLNANRGAFGTSWGRDTAGSLIFGADQGYEAPGDTLADNLYAVTFTANNGTKTTLADHTLELSPDDVAADRSIGTLSLSGVAKGSSITWSTGDANKGNIGVNETTGQLYLYDNATGTVTATEHLADGSERTAATVVIRAKSQPIDDFQIWYNGENVTGGQISVAGSEVRNLEVRVHYTGSADGEYVPASFTRFVFQGSDPSILYSNTYSACFSFKRTGTAKISVSSRSWANAGTKSVTVTSTPVAATSIQMGYAADGKTILLHGRNPLSTKGLAFLTDKASPVVTPDNASNRGNFTVTSSNPAVAAYTTSGDIGFTPYKAGTTTFTATLPDTDANGTQLSASVNVTYAYQNPLKSVKAKTSKLSLKAGKSAALDLAYTGKRDSEGYSVSEPGLTWTYSTDGVVSIDPTDGGAWKHQTGAPDDGLFLATGNYTVTALKAGTVVATGTPIDQTAGAQPVTVTITVTGVAPAPKTEQVAQTGLESAARYLDATRYEDSYQYLQEWELYSFLKAGRTIPQAMLDRYVASAKNTRATWLGTPTETERVGLALAALGKDITSFDGTDLVATVCNNPNLGRTYNELVYALLMIDEAGATPAAGSAWTRGKLVDAVTAGLTDARAESNGSVDMTAMAIQALAPYYASDSAVQSAVDAALAWLRTQMSAGTCDFGSAESNAQVLLALLALDLDPASEAVGFANASHSVVTALASYQVSGNGFSHLKGGKAELMPTVQALQALTLYQVSANGSVNWSFLGAVTQGGVERENGGKDPITPAPVPEEGKNEGSKEEEKQKAQDDPKKRPAAHETPKPQATTGKKADGNAEADTTASASTAATSNTDADGSEVSDAAVGTIAKTSLNADEAVSSLPTFALAMGGVGLLGLVFAAILYRRSKSA